MNKLFKVFALATMMFLTSQAVAQTRGAIFLGASFPMKDYAAFNGFNDFALTSVYDDANEAGAGMGFNVGFKWYFNIGVKGLDVMLSLDGLYNGPCENLKAAYRDQESTSSSLLWEDSFKYNSTPGYINAPAMLGLSYNYAINSNFGLYIEAGAGGNLRFITDLESVARTTVLGVETQIRTIQEYDKAFSFAYQVGAGVRVANKLMIGCSFYDLGSAVVKGEETVRTTTLNDNVTRTDYNYKTFGSVHPIMLVGRVAFSF